MELTPYDTGGRCVPRPWFPDEQSVRQARADGLHEAVGLVDVDDDDGHTVVAITVARVGTIRSGSTSMWRRSSLNRSYRWSSTSSRSCEGRVHSNRFDVNHSANHSLLKEGARGMVYVNHEDAAHEAMRPMTEESYSHVVLVTGSRTWDDEDAMRQAFNAAWLAWVPATVIRPVLLSGHNQRGADAMAERLWENAGFEVRAFPAQWDTYGRSAGYRRNDEMVRAAMAFQHAGTPVRCIAFLALCVAPECTRHRGHDLVEAGGPPGHFSHGSLHCRQAALSAGLPVDDVPHPSVPPF